MLDDVAFEGDIAFCSLVKTMGLWDPREHLCSKSKDRSTCPNTNEFESPSMSDRSSNDGEEDTPDNTTQNELLIRYVSLDFEMI